MPQAEEYKVLDLLTALRNIIKNDTYFQTLLLNDASGLAVVHEEGFEEKQFIDFPAVAIWSEFEIKGDIQDIAGIQKSHPVIYIDVGREDGNFGNQVDSSDSGFNLARQESYKTCVDVIYTLGQDENSNLTGLVGDFVSGDIFPMGRLDGKNKPFGYWHQIVLTFDTTDF